MKNFVLSFFLFGAAAFVDPITALQLSGSASSYVVGNQTLLLGPADGYAITPSVQDLHGATGPDLIGFTIDAGYGPNTHWFMLFFAAPYGQALAPGEHQNATRYPFENSDVPGLSLFGDGRGDNESTGHFDILQLSYAGDQILSFAADFVQFDELDPNAISSGSIRFHSDIPLGSTSPAPEPSRYCLLGFGLLALAARPWRVLTQRNIGRT